MIKKRYLLFLILPIMLLSTYTSAHAASKNNFDNDATVGNRNNLFYGPTIGDPDLTSFPFTSTPSSVGFNQLFPLNGRLNGYLGEIPHSFEKDKDFENLPIQKSDKINGAKRGWQQDNGIKKDKLDPDSDDYHINSIREQKLGNTSGASSIGFQISKGFSSIMLQLLKLETFIKSLDLSTIISNTVGKDISNAFVKLFLVDKDKNGAIKSISPFFILLMAMSIFGIVGATTQAIRGGKSGRYVFEELGFWLLAAFVFAMATNYSAQSQLTKTGITTATSITNSISSVASDSSFLFKVSDDKHPKTALDVTQYNLLQQTSYEISIETQFGIPASQLYITDSNGKYSNNFGRDYQKAINETFKNVSSEKANFQVSTDNGSNYVNNLGYYWIAASSETDEKKPFSIDSGYLSINSSTPDRRLYVIDFLENAKRYATQNKEKNVITRINTIEKSLQSPRYGSGTFGYLIAGVQYGLMFWALIPVVMLLSIGNVIISTGIFGLPVLPGLILFKKTRKIAKQAALVYLMAFFRLVAGIALFGLLYSIVTLLNSTGMGGRLFAIIFILAFQGVVPYILSEINHFAGRYERNVPIINNIDRGMNRMLNNKYFNGPGYGINNRIKKRRSKRDEKNRKEAAKTSSERSKNKDLNDEVKNSENLFRNSSGESASERDKSKNVVNDFTPLTDEEMSKMNVTNSDGKIWVRDSKGNIIERDLSEKSKDALNASEDSNSGIKEANINRRRTANVASRLVRTRGKDENKEEEYLKKLASSEHLTDEEKEKLELINAQLGKNRMKMQNLNGNKSLKLEKSIDKLKRSKQYQSMTDEEKQLAERELINTAYNISSKPSDVYNERTDKMNSKRYKFITSKDSKQHFQNNLEEKAKRTKNVNSLMDSNRKLEEERDRILMAGAYRSKESKSNYSEESRTASSGRNIRINGEVPSSSGTRKPSNGSPIILNGVNPSRSKSKSESTPSFQIRKPEVKTPKGGKGGSGIVFRDDTPISSARDSRKLKAQHLSINGSIARNTSKPSKSRKPTRKSSSVSTKRKSPSTSSSSRRK
ncbi:hypothetical protein [Enterococcus sp. AZ180]|uniref:hypothetical protein n=1 Tax=Enterococcus sp. AZ180 TaxID=2774961 RepID=UPI003F20C612